MPRFSDEENAPEYLPGLEPSSCIDEASAEPPRRARRRKKRAIQRAWFELPREENERLNEYCLSFHTGERKRDILRRIIMSFCEARYVMLSQDLQPALLRRAFRSGVSVDVIVDSMVRMGLLAMERQERV